MDTWATSSLSPQIVGLWLDDEPFFNRVFPMTLRPHAHEIIRTWTFYTIVKSWYHLGQGALAERGYLGVRAACRRGRRSASRAAGGRWTPGR